MFKKYFLAILTSFSITALQADLLSTIPDEFYVKQRWCSWTTTFDIETANMKLGYVTRRFWSLTLNYDFYDNFDVLHATAKKRFWSFGAVFDVTDAYERPIGRVEDKFSCFFPTFEIISPREEIIAKAELNFWGTKYTLFDPIDGHVIATLKRPFIRLKSDWVATVVDRHVLNETRVDPRLFVVVMAFQTDMDYWQSHAEYKPMKAEVSEPKEHLALMTLIDSYKGEFEGIDPAESDLEKIENFADDYLKKLEYRPEQEWTPEVRLAEGVKSLCELFESNTLTLSEKSALYMLLKERLSRG